MSVRYNPHRIAREALDRPRTHPLPSGSAQEHVRRRAEAAWSGTEYWTGVSPERFGVEAAVADEYGYDALCIASITSGTVPPEAALLESAFRWLALVHDGMCAALSPAGAPDGSAPTEAWDCSAWLTAAFAARDHLLLRNHPYPALAAVRKAWKQAPPKPGMPIDGLRLIGALLFPFAPLLGRYLLEGCGGWPIATIERLAAPFLPRKAVRIALERGGWNWIAVDADRFVAEPARELAGVSWISHAFGSRPWTVRPEGEGWRLCQSRPPANAASSLS
ncbi:MAG TPA: hypothetical protein PLP29_05365 [Candidatus Ozemobacteraceae bacterium]|nr:hypothetical protein [Candidatus Ozemobacteraceae bacterium]